MSRYKHSKFRYRLKSFFLPIFLIICLVAAIFSFHKFFIVQPQQKGEYIKQLIEDEKYAEAADLLYDFSYKEYSNKEILQQICEGRPDLVLYTLDVGDTTYLGKYEQDNNLDNGSEPIEWRVVDIRHKKLILEAVKVIEYMPVNNENAKWDSKSKWEDSTLSRWLNTSFYRNAFTDAEKGVISIGDGERITIINRKDNYSLKIANVWISDTSAEATLYAKSKGINVGEDGLSPVWTSSKYNANNLFENYYWKYYVAFSGHYSGERVSIPFGIRPIICVSVSSLVDKSVVEGS